MRKEIEITARLSLASILMFSGCAPTREALMIDRQVAAGLGDYADGANKNLDLVDKACQEVPGYISGTEKIAQFVGADGRLHGWAFCDGDGGTWVAGHMSEGKTFVPVVERFVYTTGTDAAGNSGTLFGYVQDGETFGVYEVVNGVRQVVHPDDPNTVKVIPNGGEAKFWEEVVKSATGATDVAAAPEESTPTEEASATASATKTDTPTAKPSETATGEVDPSETPLPADGDITLEKMIKIPKNKSEIKTSCAKSPDMFTDSEGFEKALTEYTTLIETNIIPTHTGPVLTPGVGVGLGSDGVFLTQGAEVSPVACLDANGNLVFSFIARNGDNTLSAMHVALDKDQRNYNTSSRIALADVLNNLPISIQDNSTTIELATKPEKKTNSLDNTNFSQSFWKSRGEVHTEVFDWLSGKQKWNSKKVVLLRTFYRASGGPSQISPVVKP
jgi:hypothetical protein